MTTSELVRGNLATLLAECEEAGGLPRFVERDFRRYLACGIPGLGWRTSAATYAG